MTHQEYASMPGLTNSMLKDLAISPLRFWARWIDPGREAIEPSAEMQFGSAVHCAVLEPSEFTKRYAAEVAVPEGCLDTVARAAAELGTESYREFFAGLSAKAQKGLTDTIHEECKYTAEQTDTAQGKPQAAGSASQQDEKETDGKRTQE